MCFIVSTSIYPLLSTHCSHAGDLYALSKADLKAAWDEGKLPLVEAPLSLARAIKAEQKAALASSSGSSDDSDAPRLEISCLYLVADNETLDTRLRAADLMEEIQLQEELRMAAEETTWVQQETSAASAGGDVVVDRVVFAGGSPLETLMAVREVVGSLWHRERPAIACPLVIDRFDWSSPLAMGRTELRMQTVLSSGATLELPRGRHLLRVNASHEQLHAVTFYSTSDKMIASEYIEVRVTLL